MSATRDTETYHSSLGPVNITSFDAMQEITIHENANSSAIRHHRPLPPATLPLEPSLASSVHSNDIINSSSIITANLSSKNTPIDALKEWSVSTYKCTKQLLNEKLGKCTRTVDIELETEIEKLRDTQHKYECILKLSRDMCNQYATIIVQQNAMYEHLNELAMRETKSSLSSADNFERHNTLSSDFKQNAETMRSIAKSGEKLLLALKFFTSNLSTLVYKTIEDTIATIRAFEAARLEYDAERNSINNMVCGNSSSINNSATSITSDKVNQSRSKYEKLRDDVLIKMKFLDENKAKVMHKQLVLFHNAFAAFASGNATALDSTLKQFSIRPQSASFLEN